MTTRTAAQSMSPNGQSPVDLVHLSKQTLGNRSLEREVLALFATQSTMCMEKLGAASSPAERADIVHTLKGSAQSIGAWAIAEAALGVEVAARDMVDDPELRARLVNEVAVTNAYIATLLT